MAKIVFISYAHHSRDSWLTKFRKKLEEELKVHFPGEDPLFFYDGEAIQSGDDWKERIALDVNTSKVYVAICAPAFTSSKFCGKELQVFLSRLEKWRQDAANAGEPRRPIIPVLWIKDSVPEVLRRYQASDDDFPKSYKEKGLRTLFQLKRHADASQEVVNALAERIRDARNAIDLPEGAEIPDFDLLPDALHDEAVIIPYGVAFVPLIRGGIHAVPVAGGQSLSAMIAAACGGRMPWREIALDRTVGDDLRAAAEGRQAIVVVSDLATLGDPLYANTIAAISGALGKHAAVLIARSDVDAPGAAAEANAKITVESAFAPAIAQGALVDFVRRTGEGFRARLEEVITELRRKLVAQDEPKPAADAALLSKATEQGVPIQQQPTLTGPGGRSA